MVRKNIISTIGLMLILAGQLCFADGEKGSPKPWKSVNPAGQTQATQQSGQSYEQAAPAAVTVEQSYEQVAPAAAMVPQSEQQYEQVAPTAVMVNPFGEPQEAPAPQAVAVDQLREQAAPKAIVVDNAPQKGPAPVAMPASRLQDVVAGQPIQSTAPAGTVYGSPNPVKKMLASVNVAVQGVNVNKSAPAPQSMRAAPTGIVRTTQNN